MSMPEEGKQGLYTEDSRAHFNDCDRCSGFGYELAVGNKHKRCPKCNDNPSMFVVLDGRMVYWRPRLSQAGIVQRRFQRWVGLTINFLLMLFGVAALGWFVYRVYQLTVIGDPFGVFTDASLTGVLFWVSLVTDAYLYFRLDQMRASQRSLADGFESDKPVNVPTAPTFDNMQRLPRKGQIDAAAYYTHDAVEAIDHAYALTRELGHHVITPLHLFSALLDTSAVKMIVARLGLSKPDLFKRIAQALSVESIEKGDGVDIGLEANRILFFALEEAMDKGRDHVDVMELMVALIRHDSWLNEIFYDLEIDDHTVDNVVEWVHIQRNLRKRYIDFRRKARHKPKGIMDRAMTAVESKLVMSLTTDLTASARVGGFFPLIGRDSEMEQILRIMRQRMGNVILVGPPGVGKTTLFEGLADLMAAEEVPPELQDKRLVMLDPGSLIADAQGIGAVEGRIKRVIQEIARAGNIILGIEDIHHLLNMRSTAASEDVASILMNSLSQNQLRVVATSTTQEYQELVSRRGTFVRRFQLVQVEELERDAAILVLEARAGGVEFKNKVFFSYASLEACVDLTMQFIQDRYLPAKALDVLQEVASYVESARGQGTVVTKEDVAQVISEKTNVQVTAITDDERDKLLNLEEIMHQRVVGQDLAINAVASALRRARQGLRDTNRPIANLLFLGPTGVGKTETAKTVAEVYFGNEENMIRLDMSEYQDVNSMRKLIGSKGERGYLTEQVIQRPFSIVLLDEMEKAHPDVLNLFLQVMDDGRLTDGTGRTVDMTNTMLIATSNAATQQIQNAFAAGQRADQLHKQLMQEVLPQIFRPEFVNRFDNVVLFTPLNQDQVTEIARRLLAKMAERLKEEKGIVLEVTEAAVLELAEKGYDPQFGARPLRRVLQDTVDDALAKLLLSEQVRRRDTIMLLPGGQMKIKGATRLG